VHESTALLLSDVLTPMGWTDQRSIEFAELVARRITDDPNAMPIEPARVIRQDRGAWHVISPSGALIADLRGRVRSEVTPLEVPTVGDWVAISPRTNEGSASIEATLSRTSSLLRHAAGGTTTAQIVAANVDVVIITVPITSPPNPRRVERQLAMTAQSGARAVIVVTKIDLVEGNGATSTPVTATPVTAQSDEATPSGSASVADRYHWISEVALNTPVIALDAKHGAVVETLAPWLTPGSTLVLIGPSGAGKSTLANSLLGTEQLATGSVRTSDTRGRHTTTWRELVTLPCGALLIDTPGTRELGLWDADEGLADTFDDLSTIADECRFGNCGHSNEPGCAIVAALKAGTIDVGRVESWAKLRAELAQRETREVERQRAESRTGRPSSTPPATQEPRRRRRSKR
jgi:ribosome biogenesis GTPase / thiamine phosphate phosphatase